ncbi:TetR/AcrR family transcriptional regulator [Paenibacillus daejeonensis]|uniref:TetR/AcrR family transcriptional regulator n=1 Tax=Paenibacillus daejeonensis TaxID=135193 RepID=UPI0003753E8F|nr:TetR/AcrR family transcriptional regulator [Paenibacillus daejeonensis]
MKRDPVHAQKQITLAAAKHFAAHGLAGARVDDIANESGLNKRMIYHYYGDKHRLYEHVLEDQMNHMFHQMSNINGGDPEMQVRAAVGAYFDYCLAHPDYIALMQWEMVSGWKTLHQIYDRIDNSIQSVMVGWIEEGMARGQFHQETEPRLFVSLAIIQIICLFPMLSHPDLVRLKQPLSFGSDDVDHLKQQVTNQILRSLVSSGQGAE